MDAAAMMVRETITARAKKAGIERLAGMGVQDAADAVDLVLGVPEVRKALEAYAVCLVVAKQLSKEAAELL